MEIIGLRLTRKSLLLVLLFSFLATFALAEDEVDTQSEILQKHELIYKNGKSGGTLEKTATTQEMLEKIFTVDLRNETGFVNAIDNSILFYKLISDENAVFKYGEDEYTSSEMVSSLNLFKKLMQKKQSYEDFLADLNANFNVYTAKNTNDKAILTGYYTPHIDALQKKSRLYSVPVVVKNGKEKKPLFFVKNKRDVYNLKLEGAGIMNLPDGSKAIVEYAGKSKYKKVKTVAKKVVKKNIRVVRAKKGTKFASRTKNTVMTIPYFRVTEGGPYGWADVPLTPRYTAAIDKDLAPMGGLIYVKSYEFDNSGVSVMNSMSNSFSNFEGFMLAQDIGGAIKGGGRVDIYCGEGQDGKIGANSIKRVGTVFLLVAKKEILESEFEGSIISRHE